MCMEHFEICTLTIYEINISETNREIELKFCMLSIFKILLGDSPSDVSEEPVR